LPEIIIIICLGLALFLLLRHYPETGVRNFTTDSRERVKQVLSYFSRFKRGKGGQSVETIIDEGQDEIVAPVELEDATKKFHEKDPEIAEALLKAEQSLETGELREAEDKALEVVAKNKRSAFAYLLLGKVAFSRGQFEDAKDAFKTALKCNRDLAEALYYLGRIDFRNDNITGAIDNFQKSIYAEKGHADWYGELGRAYLEVRQYAKAAKVLKRASSLDIDNKEYRDLASEAEDKQRSHSVYTRGK